MESVLYVKKRWGGYVWGLGEYLAQTGQPYTLTSQAHFVTEDQWSGLNNELQNIESRMTKEGVAAGLRRHFVQ